MREATQTPAPDTQLFRDVFKASPIGIAVENLDGQPLFVNPAFCSMLGFSEQELRSKHCVDFSPPEDAEKDWALFQQLQAGSIDHYQLEKRYFRRDGSLMWGRLSVSLLNSRPSSLVLAMIEDITDKRAGLDREHSLLEMMSSITEQMSAAVTRCSRDFRYLWVNQAYADWIQCPVSEVVDRPISDVLGKEAFNSLLPYFKRVLLGETVQYEQQTNFQGIGRRWVSATYTPTFDPDGTTDGWVAVVLDVTDRKRAEETRFRHAAIVESYEDAIISKDLAAVITGWNVGAEHIFGYEEDEVIGQPITILIPPELWEEENRILERLRAGGRIEHYETKRIAKTGKQVDVSLTIGPIKDSTGKIVGFSKIAHDITQRKQAEKALRELNRTLEAQAELLQSREELLKVFVKHVPAAVAMLDRNMCYLQVSDRWCADYSVENSHVLGRSHYELFPDIPQRWKETHRRALEGEILRADEDRWDREDGTTVWIRWELRPWRTPSGIVGGILILAEDITRRKQAEQTLADMSRKLIESQEQERTRIGRELHDDIVQRLALLAIQLEQLQDDPIEIRNRLRELKNYTVEISHDVQTLSHELHDSKLAYLGVVASIKGWCREFGQQQRIDIDFQHAVSSALPLEIGLCLFRVLQEALHNATKYSGVPRIEVRLTEYSGEVELVVSDLGKGFDIEAARHGKGIGLLSMEERVKLVNGVIAIQTKPSGGTSVRVRVPIRTAQNPQCA